MKALLKILIVLLVLGALAYGVKLYFFTTNPSQSLGEMVSVKVASQDISTSISATGSLEPVDQVEVGTQVSGDISKIYVDFNSKVTKGQIIAELDKSKLKATLDQAQIAYQSAENDYKFKKSSYERVKKLAESNSASAVELEQAEYNMNAAKFSMERSKNEVDQAKLNISYCTIRSPINGVILERAVDVGQTVAASMSAPTLFIIAKDLSQMKVMAAVDEADIGSVKAGQKVSFTVDAFQNEKFNGSVQEVRLNPVTTSNVVTYTVVIAAENPDLKLLPGMTATCTIVTQEVLGAISIPAKALKFTPAEGTPMAEPPQHPQKRPDLPGKTMDPPPDFDAPPGPGPDQGPGAFPGKGGFAKNGFGKFSGKKRPRGQFKGNTVWININGKVAPRRVKVGISDGINVEILKGLSLEDSVVVSQEVRSTETPKENISSPFMPAPPGKKKK
ncbi:MAG: efflux RND transporter periplasmic adaptor subunit [Fibrobacteraceae bacterium]|nr:efflux RND transporter periplasmic adaptor subunit [Fibrobacteraceae bacterium]MCF0216826.1 efflux RND transporter periplasmic adaptor subunit [Fibrobacteraceae bacterium]